MSSGRLIVLEGLDGSGKETQTNLLAASLCAQEQTREVRTLRFPVYDSEASGPVRMYLSGAFGGKPDDVNAYAASTFYAVDRYASYKSDWQAAYEAGALIIADRYTTSNAIHQCSKLPHEQWEGFLDWLFDFEYQLLGIPEPTQVVYLSLSPKVSDCLVDERSHATGAKKDIHERDAEYLARCHEAAEWCADRCGWLRVECAPGGQLRSIQSIHDEIDRLVAHNV